MSFLIFLELETVIKKTLLMSLTPTATFVSDTEDEGKCGGIRTWTLTFAFVFLTDDI